MDRRGGEKKDRVRGAAAVPETPERTAEDEEAYRLSLTGDESAAEELVERYGDAITFYVNGYIHDMHEAEDIMIEAFAQMFAKERPVARGGSFRAYIYKTARNLALRHKRRHRIFVSMDEIAFDLQSSELTESGILEDERNSRLYKAMEQLKAEYQEALYLVYSQDMSYREAGAVMKKTESQITKLVYRGKQKLREILEKEGFEYEDD